MKQVIVVGGGPAGLMAAVKAAEQGAEVTLLEKMNSPGKKLLITGKGRCNMTNACEVEDFFNNIPGNGAFMNSSLRAFDNHDVMAFFEDSGVPIVVERGNRVFPLSSKSRDVLDALIIRIHELGGTIRTKCQVKSIMAEEGWVKAVQLEDGTALKCDALIMATGGSSYPLTGSTGDGYDMARRLGHSVTSILPALVPLETEEEWVKEAQGLSLRNVEATLLVDGKKEKQLFGEMLFTHFGISGPIILSLSRTAAFALAAGKFVECSINLKPALSEEKLWNRLRRDLEKYRNKQLKNAMHDLLPGKLITPVLDMAFLDAERPVNQVTREEQLRLVKTMQQLVLTISSTRPINEAIVTAGGVSIKEVNPKTMESKLIKGLYFAGELLDVDAYTGGFNLQCAFSTGAAAGCWSVWNE